MRFRNSRLRTRSTALRAFAAWAPLHEFRASVRGGGACGATDRRPWATVESAGHAVRDVPHPLNAVSSFPPDTVVQVGGHAAADGLATDIDGRGMTDEKSAQINERIAGSAERYGVQVSRKRSAHGGTTAVAVIPRAPVVEPSGLQTTAKPQQTTATAVRKTAVPGGPGEHRLPVAVPSLTSERPAAHSNGWGAASSTGRGGDARTAGDDKSDDAPAKARTRPGRGIANGAARPEDDSEPPEEQPTVPENASTPSGLPVRVPQANLVSPLREAAQDERQDEEPDEPGGRSPEEVLRIMGSYQEGTRRGRDEAARTMGTRAAEGEDDH
ncbi:hypothetical protein Acsp04_53970 [Actinomadura sp. NBRC 104425]|uniref:hypothetical protein n=1 Tax=Actinomadura sp. NBRC 104425 TaxID=3032204 RepID=UPI0024A0705D|nr:hypothetical protein [Actinomadura sp. NBRC 104425]GLZ15162.1 hypothetical protein Acsp04_53970 [Actinomadura sp. NBRC 104425]